LKVPALFARHVPVCYPASYPACPRWGDTYNSCTSPSCF